MRWGFQKNEGGGIQVPKGIFGTTGIVECFWGEDGEVGGLWVVVIGGGDDVNKRI